MIRAHLATFPQRQNILFDTINSIASQVDRLCICLNDYDTPPAELDVFQNVEVLIPEHDLKDAGKFAFPVEPDDIVFTIDDDIIYPPDYVERTIRLSDTLNLKYNTISYEGSAYVFKKRLGRHSWRRFAFDKECSQFMKVDVLGSGAACFMGKNCPPFSRISPCAGYVDLPFSRHNIQFGIRMWTPPRHQDYVVQNMPEHLLKSTLYKKVHSQPTVEMENELRDLINERTPHSGLSLDKFRAMMG